MQEGTNILSVAALTPDVRRVRRGAFENMQPGRWGQLRLKIRTSAVAGWIICFSDFSLWFSLPLSIWLSTGWVGLIFHWQAIARRACQAEVAAGDLMSRQQTEGNVS
ncbi:MAG TPA: hypothetical protein VK574_15535 [Terracidiphilus sp.]|jgi:hypothetical protein|nr:hypothetical protein [Terracidiphilus sp.]